jgi:hypothetical protein
VNAYTIRNMCDKTKTTNIGVRKATDSLTPLRFKTVRTISTKRATNTLYS